MNRPVIKVLLKILLGFWIMEPIPDKMRRRRRRTTMWDGILRRGILFGCHRRNAIEKRQKHTRSLAQERRKEKNNAWKCMSMLCVKRRASWAKTESKLQHSQFIISHTILECMNIWKNSKECNAWACEIITTKPNPTILAKTQNPEFF